MFFLFPIIVYREGIVNVFFASLYGINIKIACRTNNILPYFNKKPIQSNFLGAETKCRQSGGKKHFIGTFLLPFLQNKKSVLFDRL